MTGTANFTSGTLATVETLIGSIGADTVTLTAAQFAGFTSVDLDGGTDSLTVNVSGTQNISASTFPTLANVESVILQGSAGVDTLTLIGAQASAFTKIDLGASSDTLILASTSTGLNALSDTNLSNVETISAAGAAAGVTIDLSSQTEGFTIVGSSHADTLTGGTGSDNFNLAAGDFATGESISGGAGADAIVLQGAGTYDFSAGSLSSIETLTGSSGADAVTMTASQFTGITAINLGGGTDSLTVNVSGAQNLSAATFPTVSNTESVILQGSAAADTVTLSGAEANVFTKIDLGGSADTLVLTSTSTGLNSLSNGNLVNVETISAAGAAAGVSINLANQSEGFTIIGSAHADTFTGGSAADTFNLAEGDFTAGKSITGNGGIDTIALTSAGASYDLSAGTIASIENVTGSAGSETLTLTSGQLLSLSSIDMGAGSDDTLVIKVDGAIDLSAAILPTLAGIEHVTLLGAGNDETVTLTGAQASIFSLIDLGGGTDTIELLDTSAGLNGLGDGGLTGVETISAAGAAAGVTINLANQSEGIAIIGSSQDDVLAASSGGAAIDGGDGIDILTLVRTSSATPLVVDISAGGGGADIGDGTSLSNIEALNFAGGSGADTVIGGSLADTIDGGLGADTINGGDGDDVITSSAGADIIDGGNDSDTLNLVRTGSTADFTIDISAGGDGSDIGDGSTIANVEVLNFTGGSGNDTVTGGGLADVLHGGAGNDTLDGGAGADTLDGGADDDTIYSADGQGPDLIDGGSGIDTLYASRESSSDNLTVDISAGGGGANIGDGTTIANIEILNFTGGTGNDILTGGGLDDSLSGGDGADTLNGGDGADVLDGGAGADILNGGLGADTIISDDGQGPDTHRWRRRQ